MRKKINILLLCLLVLLLCYPRYQAYTLKTNQESVAFEQLNKETLAKNRENPHKDFSLAKIKDINAGGVILHRNQADLSKVIGQLVIPAINKNIVIFDGLENNALYHGAATMKAGQKMGTGNYAIAGHYCEDSSLLFGGIVDLKKGQLVKLTDKNKIYFYRIFETKVVPDTRVDLIEDAYQKTLKRKNPILSLMTCYYNIPGKRFFVFAELCDIQDYSTAVMLQGLK